MERSDMRLPSNYPPTLRKACMDTSTFAIGLLDGTRLVFEHAEPIGCEWVHLEGVTSSPYPYAFERGLDVRVDAIAWVADAPDGS